MTDYKKTIEAQTHCYAGFVVFVSQKSWQPSSFPRIEEEEQRIVLFDQILYNLKVLERFLDLLLRCYKVPRHRN